MNGNGHEFFSPYGSGVAMEVAGRKVLEKNGHVIHQTVYTKGDNSSFGGEVKTGITGNIETKFDVYNVSPFSNSSCPPILVIPVAVRDTEYSRTLWVKGHSLPFGDKIQGDSGGDETVINQQIVKTRHGLSYKLVGSGSY